MSKDSMDLMKGTLDLLLMEGLSDGRELHGFALQDWLRDVSEGHFEVAEGALYPALHRMTARGWLSATWGISDRGRRARCYRLTTAGLKALKAERERWQWCVETMSRVVKA